MAKKGEMLGKIGDSTYYRTPDGKVVDDSGEEVKGAIAKTLAAEYEAKQQERAAQQAEAKKAADEAKAAKAAQAAAEKQARQQRLAAERQAAADMKRQQAAAEREALKQTNQQSSQRANVQSRSAAPAQEAPKAGPTVSQRVGGAFKQAAMNVGQTAFNAAFPTISGIINRNVPDRENEPVSAGGGGGGGSRQSLNRIADEINTTNQMLQTNTARAEMTNQILGLILKEVQQLKKPSLLESLIGGAGSLLGMGEAVAGAGAGAGAAGAGKAVRGVKAIPKTGVLGGARGLLRTAPLIGALLGGGKSAYDEYQESGNATRAASTGVGAAAGGALGAWGGAEAGAMGGAALGTLLFPGVGTAIGGALGGVGGALIGGFGGSWLGGKAGKAGYDALATPSKPKNEVLPEASKDIKAAQEAAKINNQLLEFPKDSIVNVKTLTFNADSIIFNVKSQQAVPTATPASVPAATVVAPNTAPPPVVPTNSVATGASAASVASGGKPIPLPNVQNISAPSQSIPNSSSAGSTSYQVPPQESDANGGSIIQAARENTTSAGTQSMFVRPGQAAPNKVKPNQNATGGANSGMSTIMTKSGHSAKVASQYAKNFQGFIDALEGSGYKIKSLGGFANRNIAGSGIASWHAKGMAIDINPGPNPVTFGAPGRKPVTDMPGNVQSLAAQFGLGWGGAWDGKKQDSMHFSLGEGPGALLRGQRAAVGLGSGGVGSSNGGNTTEAAATRSSGVGNSSGATSSSSPSQADATPSSGASAASSGGAVTSAGAGRGDGNAELAARAADAGAKDASQQEAPEAVAAKLSPKESGVMAGIGGIPPQLKGIMGGVLQGFLGNSRGSQLVQASMREIMSDRSARTGITVNQHTSQTPTTNTTGGKFNHHDVGHVEPVDARTRLKELFGILAG
jgi:hypothetical protein